MNDALRASEPGGPDLRVIVVGRPSVEGALRRDAGIELIRARTPAMALGELRFSVDAESPEQTALVVGADALHDAEIGVFARAARAIDEHVFIAGDWTDDRAPVGSVDGRLAPNADAHALRGLMAAPRSTPEPAPSTAASAPATEPSVIDAMLRGGDVGGAALREIQARLGTSAQLVTEAGEGRAEVRRAKAQFGWLEAPGAAPEDLKREAATLAGWLALEQQHKQLQTAAFTDDLTGAWNRRYFRRFLEQAIENARNQRRDVTLMVYDIDDFKQYNDRFGHAAGDEILTETVRLLCSVIRPTDRVCRVGGDEFAVIFDDPRGARSPNAQHPTSIAGIAERFQRQICSHRFPKLGAEAPSTLTISAGMATFPWDGQDAESLLAKADSLALESKRQGKNVITLGPGAERVCRLHFPPPEGPDPTG